MHHGACMQQAAQREQQDSGSIAVGAIVQQVRTLFGSRAASGERTAGMCGMLKPAAGRAAGSCVLNRTASGGRV